MDTSPAKFGGVVKFMLPYEVITLAVRSAGVDWEVSTFMSP